MTFRRILTSDQFGHEVLEHDGPVLVVFPAASSLITDFVQQQIEIVSSWRPYLNVVLYDPEDEEPDDDKGTLVALYCEGNFVGATSRYYFAEHLDAWVASSLTDYRNVMEAEEDNGELQ
ncbi:MAG: hypothetical protein U5N86_02490 [Planctomycetota bacterium]|nr:hypothetical protein [Planctomycetota bacterium]